MTVRLSNQPQIPVIAPGYLVPNKHVWEGQWLLIDTQTWETRPPKSAAVLVLILLWSQDVMWDFGEKHVEIKKRRKDGGHEKKNICTTKD